MTEPTLVRDEGSGPTRLHDTRSYGRDGHSWTGLVLGAALVSIALVTGLIFTFSAAVMPNLADADDRTFVETMQRFDENPVFPLTFTAALLLVGLAAVLQRRHGPGVALRWTVAALVLYGIVFAVTIGLHLPLNSEFEQAVEAGRAADFAEVRSDTEGPWVAGNIVRTLFSTAALAALARSLLLFGRDPTDRPPGA